MDAAMKKKVILQYYYRNNDCKAKTSDNKDCICWSDEGSGIFKDDRHDDEEPTKEWRIKPSDS